MTKLHTGDVMRDFTFRTPFETGRTLGETVRQVPGKTALVFLRYLGCTSCQFEIRQYALNYEKIKETGGQMLIVLQSDPQRVADETKDFPLPFDVICDPDRELYLEFEIPVAKDKDELHDFNSKKWAAKRAIVKAAGLTHGVYEGEELQLPATFVFDHDLNIVFDYYGKDSNDNLSADELAKLL